MKKEKRKQAEVGNEKLLYIILGWLLLFPLYMSGQDYDRTHNDLRNLPVLKSDGWEDLPEGYYILIIATIVYGIFMRKRLKSKKDNL